MPPEKINRQQLEEDFRAELSKLVDLARALAPICTTTDDLVGICELAQTNDGQLRMLMDTCTRPMQIKR